MSAGNFVAGTFKSAAPYFMAGNAGLNWETNPLISVFYAAALAIQTPLRGLTHSGATLQSPVAKFFAGDQGALATNAVVTTVVGIGTVAVGGSILLGGAAIAFGAANMTQALIYSGKLKFKNPVAKNFALAACEIGMIGGFTAIGAHVGLETTALAAIAAVGGVMASFRSFKPAMLHPDLAYADMIVTAGLTCMQAVATHNVPIAVSRVLAMIGVSRLAVLRAANEKRTSVFAVEQHVPKLIRQVPKLWSTLRP